MINDELKNEIKHSLEQIEELLIIAESTRYLLELTELLHLPVEGELFESLEAIKNNPICPLEIKELIAHLEEQLLSFEADYNLKIQSTKQLKALTEKYSYEYLKELSKGVDDLAQENLEEYKMLLDSFGKSTETLDKLINMPSTKEDILKAVEDEIKKQSNERKEEHKHKENNESTYVPPMSENKEKTDDINNNEGNIAEKDKADANNRPQPEADKDIKTEEEKPKEENNEGNNNEKEHQGTHSDKSHGGNGDKDREPNKIN